MAADPGIDEALIGYDVEHLAVDRAVPCARRRRLVSEAIAELRAEARWCHAQPAAHQPARGQRLPDRLGSMREYLIDHDLLGTALQNGVVHGSISSNKMRKLFNRSRQKAS